MVSCAGFIKVKMQNKFGAPVAFVDFKDMDSSTEAINRLQGVILYSSTGEGMRLEYPTFRDYLNFLLLYLSSNSSCRVYLELIAEAKCDLYFLTMPF
jgi:hypothetical protein